MWKHVPHSSANETPGLAWRLSPKQILRVISVLEFIGNGDVRFSLKKVKSGFSKGARCWSAEILNIPADFHFKFDSDPEAEHQPQMLLMVSPGELYLTQTVYPRDWENAISELEAWAQRVDEEVQALQSDELKFLAGWEPPNESGPVHGAAAPPTKDEVAEIKARLDAALAGLSARADTSEAEIVVLKAGFNRIAADLEAATKARVSRTGVRGMLMGSLGVVATEAFKDAEVRKWAWKKLVQLFGGDSTPGLPG